VKTPPQHTSPIVLLALALAPALSGCALTFDATALGVPATMATAATRPAAGDTFNIHSKAMFLFWGLYASSEPSLEHALEGQVAGGRTVQNLRIRVYRRWSDLLITALTAGFVAPVSVTFQGILTAPPS